jgi:plastocyanin
MKQLVMVTVMAISIVATPSISMVSANDEKKVNVKGLESFEANALFLSNLRFAPEDIKVEKGDTLTWVDDALTAVPHTITIVDREILPVDFATAYICLWDKTILGVDGPCLQFMDAHGGVPPTRPVVNVGPSGLDAPGDSIFLPPNGSVSAQVTAGPGRVLHYMCIIHPWMQGKITIEDRKRRK